MKNQEDKNLEKNHQPDTLLPLVSDTSAPEGSEVPETASEDIGPHGAAILTRPALTKKWLIRIVAAFLPLFAFGNQIVFRYIGLFMYTEQFVMIFIGASMFLLFLTIPARKKDKSKWMPWDVLPAVICLAACLYVALNWKTIYVQPASRTTVFQLVTGILIILFTIEACRRTVGWPMIGVILLFLAYAFFGNNLTGALRAAKFSVAKVVHYVYLTTSGLFGMPSETAAVTVIAFTLFGTFLSATKAGNFFYNLSKALVGTVRGGGAKVAIVCSAFFATMTGEPISNCGIVGPLTLPLMKQLKYDPVFSGATVATASCGSMITPPVMAAIAFIMGQLTGFGYTAVCIAAIIPALLYYLSVYMQVDFYAAKKNYTAIEKKDIPKISSVFKEGWQYLVPLAFLIYWLLVRRLTPATAVYYATGILIPVALIKKVDRKFFLQKVKTVFSECGKAIIITACLCAASGIIMGLVTVTGFGLKLSASLGTLAGGNLLILAILSAVCIYIMGMGMPPLISYLMLAILVAPAMVNMGVELMAAHFFILYMSISAFITPPVALAGYVCGQMVGERGISVCFKAMRLGIVCYLIPFVSVYTPSLLLQGDPLDIALSTVTAIVGVIFIASGLEGFFFKKVNYVFRFLFIAGGLLLFIPGTLTDVIGLALGITPLIEQIVFRAKNERRYSL
ncbi:MAG: TRAP transporter fused permease subunit [Oscillospiraceae bacterium]|nr:TRAP transporter fused permease subunit [Oscillospiraceae bacterium]